MWLRNQDENVSENNTHVGRNDPCPCGSGKKFKKCCFSGSQENEVNKVQLVKPYKLIDYGKPSLNDDFLSNDSLHEISAPRLFYSNLIRPEISGMAAEFAKKNFGLKRGASERMRIEGANGLSALIEIMSASPDIMNHDLLMDKVLSHQEEALPIILEALGQDKNTDGFVELAIRILHRSNRDCSKEILDLVTQKQLDAYKVVLLCVLLGFYDNEESTQVLWNYFHYFKEHFPDKTHSDGPLLGMMEMSDRRQSK